MEAKSLILHSFAKYTLRKGIKEIYQITGLNGIKIKIMPDSTNVNLKEIEKKAKEIVESLGGFNKEYSIEPVAFGLKALIVFFQFPEDDDAEKVENALKKIKNVQSVQLIDMRKIA